MGFTNLAAFTNLHSPYPAYVSINEHNGLVTISVRSNGAQNPSDITMSAIEFAEFLVPLVRKASAIIEKEMREVFYP